MSKLGSKFCYMYDAAAAASLLNKGSAAKTASFNGSEIALDKLAGQWNTKGELADFALAAIINVINIGPKSARSTATITLTAVVATDAVTFNDDVNPALTLTAGTDFAVGVSDTATATNLAAKINERNGAGVLAMTATSAGAVVTVTITTGVGGSITENETTISVSNFVGNDETYTLEIQGGPVGFASSKLLGALPGITKTGQYAVLIDIDTAKALKTDLAAIRLAGTLGGLSPSITAHSWIAGLHK